MSKNIIKNIEELKELQAVLKKYNKQEAIKYIMDKTGVSENDSLEIYYFLTKNTSNSITHKQNKIFTSIIFYCLVSLTGIILLFSQFDWYNYFAYIRNCCSCFYSLLFCMSYWWDYTSYKWYI